MGNQRGYRSVPNGTCSLFTSLCLDLQTERGAYSKKFLLKFPNNFHDFCRIVRIHRPVVTVQFLQRIFSAVVAGCPRVESAKVRADNLNRFFDTLKVRSAGSPAERIITARLFSAG